MHSVIEILRNKIATFHVLSLLGSYSLQIRNLVTDIVLIPAYCPSPVLIDQCARLAREHVQIVVVDDGTPDREPYTPVFSAIQQYENVILLHQNKNCGKGRAIKTGLRWISEHCCEQFYVVTMDADGQHDASDAIKLLLSTHKHPDDYILGVRSFNKPEVNIPARSRWGNTISSLLFFIATGKRVSDTQTGLRGFSSNLIPSLISIDGERYDYEMNALLHLAKDDVPFQQIPIQTIYLDNNISSHFQPVSDSLRIVKQFVIFSLSSFSSFLIDYSLFSVLIFFLGQSFAVFANVFSRIISGTYNYLVNDKVVFGQKRVTVHSIVQYVILALFILLLNTILLLLLMSIGIDAYLAKICTEISLFALSFIVQKFIIFKP